MALGAVLSLPCSLESRFPYHSPIKDIHIQAGKPKNTGVGSLSLLQGDLPDPGIKARSPALQADSLPAEQGSPIWIISNENNTSH